MSTEDGKLPLGLVNFVGVNDANGLMCTDGGITTAINHDRFMTVPLKVHYRDTLHEFSLPAECTLKELYQALAKQLAGIDPNGEIMLERQAEATYEVNLPPGSY